MTCVVRGNVPVDVEVGEAALLEGKIGFHGGKVEMERPRLRRFDGKEYVLPSRGAAVSENWLGKWAMNQMLINVSTLVRRWFQFNNPSPSSAALLLSAAVVRPHPPDKDG
jgi:hypothetical protein